MNDTAVAAKASVITDYQTQFAKALKELRDTYPSLLYTPNVAQERPLRDLFKPPYPFIQIVTFGNGAGKTAMLAADIVGVMMGKEFLSDKWYVEDGKTYSAELIGFYDQFIELRNEGKLKCRIVCDAEDMRENGSMYEAIKALIPTAKFRGAKSGSNFKQIDIPHPHIKNVKNTIDVKTFDQDTTSHAGANLQRIWINEPPPYPVFSENVRRTRSKKGELGGSILIAATVLSKAVWLFKLKNDDIVKGNGQVLIYRGCSWENCCGEDITEEVAVLYEEKMGFPLKKNAKGEYVTRGHLSRQSIENMIETLKQEYPDEVDAFIWGENVLMSGSIYKQFRKDVHVIPRYVPAPDYPVIQVVDPHPVKPDASLWATVNPMGQCIIFMENPSEPYETLRNRREVIPETCEIWRRMEHEMDVYEQIGDNRVGDPNRFRTKDSRDNRPLYMLYEECGFSFNTTVNDGLDVGHKEVQKMLYYPKELFKLHPTDPKAQPMLLVTENCRNTITAMLNYGTKMQHDPTAAMSSKVDDKYKDFADLVRYLVMYLCTHSFYDLKRARGFGKSDYQKILSGRTLGGGSVYEEGGGSFDYNAITAGREVEVF